MASVLRAFASSECYAIYPLRNDHAGPQPCALFGVSPDPQHPLHGVIWFLGTEDMKGRGLSILREAPRWLDHLSRNYPAGLHNFADKRNWLHIRWCMLTGFTAGQSVPVNGVPFQYIHRPVGVPPRV